jgi:uncharacterized damage-inducible protein DinB
VSQLISYLASPTRIVPIRGMLHESRQCFLRGVRPLGEDDSAFAPADGARTTAQQVAAVARMVDWFVEGALGGGFDYDYVALEEEIRRETSFTRAIDRTNAAFDRAIERLRAAPLRRLMRRLPEGGMLSHEPAISVIGGIVDHTAHQRGVLAAYIEQLGRVPGFPYKFHHTLEVRVPPGVVVTG